jgi:hypothetical protein
MLYRSLISCLLGRGWLTTGQTYLLLRAFRDFTKALAVDKETPTAPLKVRRSLKLSVLWATAVVLVLHRNLVATAMLLLMFVVVLQSYLFVSSVGAVVK